VNISAIRSLVAQKFIEIKPFFTIISQKVMIYVRMQQSVIFWLPKIPNKVQKSESHT